MGGAKTADRHSEFEEATLAHGEALYRTAHRLTHNAADAEDLVQDTYLTAYRFFHRFEKGTNARAWLFTILTNLFKNKYRKQKRAPETVDFGTVEEFYASVEKELLSPDPKEDPNGFTHLLDDHLNQALLALPEEFRMVIILNVIEGFSYKEVSDILHCPIGTVMSRLYRGRRMLKEMLKEYAREHRIKQ